MPDTSVPTVPDLQARLRFLLTPAAHEVHAGALERVDWIETHMSWVFLVGDHVLKLKKAVRYPFLDFSTLSAREFDCREELRLNARLAPGVYLGLMALQWQHGALRLVPENRLHETDDAPVLDWLVLMQRLPATRMLDHLIGDAAVTTADIDALTHVLVDFYRRAPVSTLGPADYLARFEHEQAINREMLLHPGLVAHSAAGTALDRLDQMLRRHAALLLERAEQGHIVDGHGDLRPEHVCLLRPPATPVVIDCLEFNADLRQVDPLDELAFLGLECEIAGAAWIGLRVIDGCRAALGPTPAAALLPLYTACRALLRARLAMAHLLESPVRTPHKWARLARRHIDRGLQALDTLDHLTPQPPLSAATTHGNP